MQLANLSAGNLVLFTWQNKPGLPVEVAANSVTKLLGYLPNELKGQNYEQLIHPEDIAQVQQTRQSALTENQSEFSQPGYRIKGKDGLFHFVYEHCQCVLNEQQDVVAFSGYIFDQSDLVRQKRRFEMVLQGTALGLWDWNPQTNEVVFDERWARMLGYELDEIEPSLESWQSRVHPDDLEQCFADIQAHMAGETQFYENIHRMRHRDGHWLYILDRGQIMEWDEQGQAIRFTGTHTDITQIKKIEKELRLSNDLLAKRNAIIEELAMLDGLTNIYNRRAFDVRLMQEWHRKTRGDSQFALLMIDVDNFKAYNDHYGHLKGDSVLIAVAQALKAVGLRKTDYVARYGGEEFVIILPNTDELGALRVAESARIAVQSLLIPHALNEAAKNVVSCSIGVALSDELSAKADPNQIIAIADGGLYQAKDNGRNQVVLAHPE